jgi:transposase
VHAVCGFLLDAPIDVRGRVARNAVNGGRRHAEVSLAATPQFNRREAGLFRRSEKRTACLIGMKACVDAHHLSRKLQVLGHDTRLMAKYVRSYSHARSLPARRFPHQYQ